MWPQTISGTRGGAFEETWRGEVKQALGYFQQMK